MPWSYFVLVAEGDIDHPDTDVSGVFLPILPKPPNFAFLLNIRSFPRLRISYLSLSFAITYVTPIVLVERESRG